MAVAASEEALKDAQLDPKKLSVEQRERIVSHVFLMGADGRVFVAGPELGVSRTS